jgi:hypothetical protein
MPKPEWIYYDGGDYSVDDTCWDRTSVSLLGILFQTTVGEIENIGLPITIPK